MDQNQKDVLIIHYQLYVINVNDLTLNHVLVTKIQMYVKIV